LPDRPNAFCHDLTQRPRVDPKNGNPLTLVVPVVFLVLPITVLFAAGLPDVGGLGTQ
jgi:hypothetical protein